jgi:hypothetical protein
MAETLTAETLFALFKETDRKMQETDRKMQETDRKMQETDRLVKEVSRLVGNLGNRLGEFVQYTVAPAALRMFQERGIEVHQIFPNAKAKRDNEGLEIDLLAVNGVELVAVECKSKLGIEDIDAHIERLKKIRRMFPQWADHRIYGAVATMVLDDRVAQHAEAKGLFVISPSGDTVEIRNSQTFQPTAY